MEYTGHQGDVKFAKVNEFPKGEVIRDEQVKRGILAFGELTGHAHQIVETDLPKVDFFKVKGKDGFEYLCLYVKEQITIEHGRERGFQGEEADKDYHDVGILEPGKYTAGIVQQFDPINKITERVLD